MIRPLFILMAVALATLVRTASAQEAPAEEQPRQPAAHVRCWIFPGKPSDKVAVTAKGTGNTEIQLGSAQGAAVSPEGYASLAPGTYSFDLNSGSEKTSSSAYQLKDGSYYTLAVVPKGGSWEIRPYSDGPLANTAAPRAVRVFSFAGGRNTLLYVGESKPSQVASGSVTELKMPPVVSPLRVEVLAADGGPPAISTVELDLKQWPCAYVVVSADYRGRMRPRVLSGGEDEEQPGL